MIFGMIDAKRNAGITNPTQCKPLCGYLRLTVDPQGNKIGYEVQRKAIKAWAEATGQSIGAWYQDKDLTAADLSVERPDFERMLADVKAGQWGGIAVWRLDRLVRLSREFERVNAVTEDARAYILSLDPLLSTKDDMGKFVMRILVMMAEMEIAAMRARQLGHQRLKAESGAVKRGGTRPFGFEGPQYSGDGRLLNEGRVFVAHVPEEAALIREAARRFAYEGESMADIVRDWASRTPPVLSSTGQIWNTTSLYKSISSPRVGGFRQHETRDPETGTKRMDMYPAVWDAILDPETWEKVRAMRKVLGERGRPNTYMLTGGTVLCGKCGWRMGAQLRKTDRDGGMKVGWYRCTPKLNHQIAGACGSNNILVEVVDDVVIKAIEQRLAQTPGLIDAVSKQSGGSDPRIPTALDTIAECDRRLEEFAKLAALPPARGGITTAEYMTIRSSVWDQRQAAASIIEAARATQSVPSPVGSERDHIGDWIRSLTPTQCRAFVRAHVQSVVIGPSKRGGSPERRRLATLGRVEPIFSDAKILDADRNEAGIGDLGADALRAAPPIEVV